MLTLGTRLSKPLDIRLKYLLANQFFKARFIFSFPDDLYLSDFVL